MKLSTVLLSSAALLVAGAAYAADLPAKKAAPAAAPTGCPAFGAGYFAIPGGDTCIKFYGYARADYGMRSGTNSTNMMNGRFQLAVDTAMNSDVGTIKTTAGISNTAGSLEWANIQAGGFTAGLQYSVSDFDQSTNSQQIGGSYTVNTLLYTAAMGSSSLSMGVESAVNSVAGSYDTWRPDIVAALSTNAGPATLSVAALSTAPRAAAVDTGAEGNGYAVSGLAKVAAGPGSIGIYGAYAYGASRVAGVSGITDFDGTNYSKVSAIGVKGTMPLGNGNIILLAGQENSSTAESPAVTTTTTKYALQYAITVAKGLTVKPELATSNNGTTTTNGGYLRIQRDF